MSGVTTEAAPPSRLGFRADVEGLRAVAVLLVVLFHAAVTGFGGGFVGVDVFFVISGFLITGLMLDEVRRTGRLHLVNFWARRARRLLPASAFVLAVTALASVLVLDPIERVIALRDIAGAALYVANWRFALRETEYLTDDTDQSPVLHYWSLGVEEQFYVVWPFLLLAAVFIARRIGGSRGRLLAILLTIVAVLSFGASLWLTGVRPPIAFFGLPTRAWQLAIGALVAVFAARIGWLRAPWRAAAGWLGLAAILASLFVIDGDTAYPGWAAVLPTLGAAAVLASGCGSVPGYGPLALLGRFGLPGVGRLSYSWYLWHWPPLVLVPAALGRPLTAPQAVALCVLSLGVAHLSYRWIEQPARYAGPLVRRPRLSLVAAGLVSAAPALLATTFVSTTGGHATATSVVALAPNGTPEQVQLRYSPAAVDNDVSPLLHNGCQVRANLVTPENNCTFGKASSATRMVLLGDSHASQWFTGLDPAAKRNDIALVTWTKSNCTMADVTLFFRDEPFLDCDRWRENVMNRLVSDPPKAVLLSGSNRADSPPAVWSGSSVLDPAAALTAWKDGFSRTVQRLQQAGIRVIVVRDTPSMGTRPSDCLAASGDINACAVPRSVAVSDPAPDVEVANASGAELWDFTDRLCTQARCMPVIGDTIAWYDATHVTASFAARMGNDMANRLRADASWNAASATRGGGRPVA